ncbi:hypothetical protein J6590_098128 [Homalodisca vitripennis]|nr:hypothetical protein J6590_098128 [Homalodisca vitripennis]
MNMEVATTNGKEEWAENPHKVQIDVNVFIRHEPPVTIGDLQFNHASSPAHLVKQDKV